MKVPLRGANEGNLTLYTRFSRDQFSWWHPHPWNPTCLGGGKSSLQVHAVLAWLTVTCLQSQLLARLLGQIRKYHMSDGFLNLELISFTPRSAIKNRLPILNAILSTRMQPHS